MCTEYFGSCGRHAQHLSQSSPVWDLICSLDETEGRANAVLASMVWDWVTSFVNKNYKRPTKKATKNNFGFVMS